MNKINETKGKSSSIFDLKNKVVGSKQPNQDSIAIIDPAKNNTLFNHNEIKGASLKYV